MTGAFAALMALEATGLVFFLVFMKKTAYECTMAELLSVSFFAGLGIVVYTLFIFDLLNIRFAVTNYLFFSAACLVAGIFIIFTLPGRIILAPPRAGSLFPLSLAEKICLSGIAIQFLWILFMVLPSPVSSHDAVANYALKSKIFYFTGLIPENFFNMPEASVAHPDYPLMLPLAMTWIYGFTGFDDVVVNIVMPVIYAAFIVLFYSLSRRQFGRTFSAICAFMLATVPQFADYAMIIHADIILAVFITAAFIYMTLYMKSLDKNYLVLSSVFFGFSLWAKNEAIVFTAAFVILLAFFLCRCAGRPPDKARSMLTVLMVLFIIAAPWFCVKLLSGPANSDIRLSEINFAGIAENIRDIPVLLDLFQQEVFGPKKWNIFWILFFGSVIWKRKKLFRGEILYMTLFMMISSACYFSAYILMTGYDLYFFANTTISRFMLHFCGAAMFLAAYLVHDDISRVLERCGGKNKGM